MSLEEKLRKHFEDNGLLMVWFSKKIGMDPLRFSQCLAGYRTWHPKWWEKIIEMSKGAVTLADFLQDKFKDPTVLDITWCEKEKCAKVFFKKD